MSPLAGCGTRLGQWTGLQTTTPGIYMESIEERARKKHHGFIDTSVKLDNEGNMKAKERES
jgi:hypothetical protein